MANTTIPPLNLNTTRIQSGAVTATKLSDLTKWMAIPPSYLNRDNEIETARIKLKVKEKELLDLTIKRKYIEKNKPHLLRAMNEIILEREKEITYIYLSYPNELLFTEDE